MFSTQSEVVQELDEEKPVSVAVYHEVLKNELKHHIETLQGGFMQAWLQDTPALITPAAKIYRSGNNQTRDKFELSIEALLETFPKRFTKFKDIEDVFEALYGQWEEERKKSPNNSFHQGYLLILQMTEMHFIEAFARSFSAPLASQPVLSEEKEQKVDVSAIASTIVKEYKTKFEKDIYAGVDALIEKVSARTQIINQQIKIFNQTFSEMADYKISQEYKNNDLNDRIQELLTEEQKLIEHTSQFQQLQSNRQILYKAREKHTEKYSKRIDRFIEKRKTELNLSEPEINAFKFDAFQAKKNRLDQLEASIDQLLRTNYIKPEQLTAKQPFLDKLKSVNELVQKYHNDHSGLFVRSRAATGKAYELLNDSYNLLSKSPIATPLEELQQPAQQELDRLNEQRDKRKQELDDLQKQLKDTVSQELSREGPVKLREAIMMRLRNELISLMEHDEIQVIGSSFLQERREALDRAWSNVFAAPEALLLVEKSFSKSAVDPVIYAAVSKKIQTYKESLPKAIEIPPTTAIPAIQPELITQEDKQQEPVSPIQSATAVQESIPDSTPATTPAKTVVAVSPPKAPEPEQPVSRWRRAWNYVQDLFGQIRNFFAYCFSCCRVEQEPLDAEFSTERQATTVIPKGGSTANMPFTVSSIDSPAIKQVERPTVVDMSSRSLDLDLVADSGKSLNNGR